MLQIDATTHPLGVEIDQQRMQFVIPRNTPFPTTKTVIFTTTQDYQKTFNIRMFEGGNEFTRDDLYLGSFSLDLKMPKLRAETKVEIQFDLDGRRKLTVTATDIDSGHSVKAVINDDWISKINYLEAKH